MSKNQQKPIRVVFTQGGKGGVGKTEIAINLATWYRREGLTPTLIDFDAENTEKSGLQNFIPEATKLNIQAPGTLDHFFEACDNEDRIVLADMGAGSGIATFDWFEKMFEESQEMNIQFTSVGVTTNEPGAILSILKWANCLRHRVDYLIVLNATLASGDTFDYWHEDPTVKKFIERSGSAVGAMRTFPQ